MNTGVIKSVSLLIFFCCCFAFSYGQIKEVQIGVDGLTCSQCTRSVEMSIRKLDFVKDVQMNLQHTEGTITFKENKQVDVEKIAQAVVNAGFSVRYLTASVSFNHVDVSPGHCFAEGGHNYEFVQTKTQTLDGTVMIKFVGNKYLPKKELKKWQPYLKNNCGIGDNKVYYVTI